MHSQPTVVSVWTQGEDLICFKEKSFDDIAKDLNIFFVNKLTRIHFECLQKSIYYDRKVFAAYLKNEISFQELQDKLWCDCLCRNTSEVIVTGEDAIDPGALWLQRGDMQVLVDDDRHLIVMSGSEFQKIV